MKTKKKVSVVIIIDNGKVLILKRAPGNRSYPEKWNFPGGGVEDGETIEEAAVREVYEEAGLKIKESDLMYFQATALPYLMIHLFMTNKFSGDVEINNESTHFEWADIDDILDFDFIPISKSMINDIKYYMELLNE